MVLRSKSVAGQLPLIFPRGCQRCEDRGYVIVESEVTDRRGRSCVRRVLLKCPSCRGRCGGH